MKTDGFLTFTVKPTATSAIRKTLCVQPKEHIVTGYRLTIANIRGGPHTPHEYVGILSERYAPAMGVLGFVKASPTFSKTFTSEEKFRVTAIEIEGNTSIETAVIQHYLPIQPGDGITGSQLSWLIAELRGHDWFQDVRLETRQEPLATGTPEVFPGISVHIRVTEAPVMLARRVKIDGNRSFPSQFIAECVSVKTRLFRR